MYEDDRDDEDSVTIFGSEFSQYMESYHPGTGAMVSMGCDADTEIGYDRSGLSYDDGILMTQIGADVGSKHFNDVHHFADIGYDMYSEYNPSGRQFAPYMGFGPSMAQTEYPHGSYDEPDMGYEIGGRRVGTDTRGAAVNAGLAAGGAAIGMHFGGPPGALVGAALGGAIRSLIG